MKAIKPLLSIVLILSFTHCKTICLTKSPPFKVTDATYNNWIGGQPGVSGIKVIITVGLDEEITFDKMYFYGKSTTIQRKSTTNKAYLIGHFNTSKRIKLERIIKKQPVKKKKTKNVKGIFPFELNENEAVISYNKGAKMFYYKVSNLKKTKTNFYP